MATLAARKAEACALAAADQTVEQAVAGRAVQVALGGLGGAQAERIAGVMQVAQARASHPVRVALGLPMGEATGTHRQRTSGGMGAAAQQAPMDPLRHIRPLRLVQEAGVSQAAAQTGPLAHMAPEVAVVAAAAAGTTAATRMEEPEVEVVAAVGVALEAHAPRLGVVPLPSTPQGPTSKCGTAPWTPATEVQAAMAGAGATAAPEDSLDGVMAVTEAIVIMAVASRMTAATVGAAGWGEPGAVGGTAAPVPAATAWALCCTEPALSTW